MDTFAGLKAFVGTVESGGFAPAARKMQVATSSVIRQVDALENHLATRLFDRTTRKVTMTVAGEIYYEHAIRLLTDLENANLEVSEAEGPPSGLLRVSLPVAFGQLHVAPALHLFSRQYPNIKLDLQLTDDISDLAAARLDLAIRLGRTQATNVIAKRIAPHKRVLCASPSYVQEHGAPSVPADLSTHNCLRFCYANGSSIWKFSGPSEESVPVSGTIQANNSQVLREAALNGMGLILMPSWLVGEDLRAGRLIRVLDQWHVNLNKDDDGIYAVYLPTRRGSKKVAAFVEFFSKRFGEYPYWDV